jgi:hypothetical protein
MTEGEQLKLDGLSSVANNNADWLDWIRSEAIYIAQERGQVCSDDLRVLADLCNHHPTHPNAWGAVFLGGDWCAIGYRKSKYKSNHARRIVVWMLAS